MQTKEWGIAVTTVIVGWGLAEFLMPVLGVVVTAGGFFYLYFNKQPAAIAAEVNSQIESDLRRNLIDLGDRLLNVM